jgi:acyl-coenzyme A synthetase/AMP-(fatty) acid ligase
VVADVVLREAPQNVDELKQDILALCRSSLPSHKIPALLNIVPSIEMTAGGKVSRQHA